MSKRNKKAKNHRKNEITKGIFTVLEKEPNKSFNYKQIAAKKILPMLKIEILLLKGLRS